MEEYPNYTEVFQGKNVPFVIRFVKKVGRTINQYNMIQNNERVLLGISGGKDSLSLAFALALRRKWLPIDYSLYALLINWEEHPLSNEKLENLKTFFKNLDINFAIKTEKMLSSGFKGEFNCYLCARNRRRILFSYAEELGIKKIALGHHLDDFTETAIMNIFKRADVSGISPVHDFFNGDLKIIRPMIQNRETEIVHIQERLCLPVCKSPCPYDKKNIRALIKPIVREISHIDTLAREHVYKALLNRDIKE